MEVWTFGIGIGVSLVLAAIRVRFADIPPALASGGIGLGLGLAGASLAWPGWPFAISIMINGALSFALADLLLTARRDKKATAILAAPAGQSVAAPLSAETRIPERRMTPQEKSALTVHLLGWVRNKDDEFNQVAINHRGGTNALDCAIDLADAFEAANWRVFQSVELPERSTLRGGILVQFNNYGDELTSDQRCVVDAFKAAGIPFQVVRGQLHMQARTGILVTESA